MAIHLAGEPTPANVPPLKHGGVLPTEQHCTRCGKRLTRPYQRFPAGASVEVTNLFTAIRLDGEPDCLPDIVEHMLDAKERQKEKR